MQQEADAASHLYLVKKESLGTFMSTKMITQFSPSTYFSEQHD